MTEYYSLGHKIVAVVLALVLMGFGWPAVNPVSIYAESDSATEQADSSAEKKAEEKKAEEAKEKAEAEKAEKKAAEEAAAKEKAEKEAAAKKEEEEAAAKKAVKEASSSKSSESKAASSASKSSSAKASDSSSSDKSDKEESDEATEYKIALKLNNASIKIKSAKDQTVTAPSTNLTVPAGKDFKFTVEPNEGYELEKVTLKSSTTKTLEADESDVYTISASSLTTGMKLTLVTEKQESSTTEEDATPIEETEDTEANEEAQDAVANADNADAGISLASLDGQSTNTVSDTSDYEVKVGDTLSLEGSSGYGHSWKSSSTTNATVKDTSGSSTTGTATVTGVKAGTVTITHTYYTYDWGYKKKNTETFAVTVMSNGNTATFNPTISNADVAYFNWHSSSDTSSISFTSVSSGGTLSISDFNSSSQAGYVVFFVKPNSNYLFTGLGADGNGDTYVVGSGQYGNIAGYPNISAVMNAAKAAGYVAAFGYSRSAKDKAPTNTAFQVKAQSPDMTITATSNKTSDVLAGDTLTFTVVMTPQLTGSGRDKVTDVEVNNVTVNGKSATCSKIIDNGDGTYTTTVEYTVTEADCSRSTVDLKVDATSTYEANLSTSLSKITTTASISKTATASCAIAPKSDVTYEFESGTSDVELPYGIYKLLPKDSKKYQKGVKVPASKTPASGDEYEDADNGGYWTFQGWDANTKTMTEDGITFIGTWTFTQCSKYTIKYVDEDGKEIAESKTSADLKVGDEINTSEIEKPEIKGYTFSSIDPASTLTIDSDESKNVITLTYKTKAGKAGYNLVLNSASWSAPEDTSQLAGSQKWYYNYGFAKGDTFQVTSSEPSAENHAFIGWMDKERDGQAAAIRSAGESVTYCYSKNQTYTLDALWASLSATGGEYVYDGTSRTISVDVNINEGTGLDPKYVEQAKKLITAGDTLYSTDGGKTWSKDKPSYTNAGEYTVKVKQDVTVGGKTTTLTAEATVVIAKRQVTLTSGSKEKEYDGKPLTNGEVSVSGDGFVDGQGATYKVTGSQTVPGSSENLFTYKLNSGTNEQNYEIEVKYGTLNVTNREAQYEITVEANSGTATYDGQQHSAVGLKTTSFVVDGETYTVSGLTTEDPAQTDAGTYTNNITGTPVVTDANENDVTDQFKVSMQNGSLTINKRSVVLESESASKVYDGTPLTKPDVTTSGEGFVDGEVSDVTATGTVTDVSQGKVTNTITYTAGEKFNENNYSITKNEGKLWITSQYIDPGTDPDNPNPDYGGVEINSPNNETYDGNEHKWAPEVKDAQGKALKEGVDYEVSYDTDNFTDVTGAITVTITGKGNYTGTVTRTYQITPRPYKVSTSTAYKTYDGKPLTAGGKIEGIVDGEDAGFVVTGSQTKVGSSDNTYEIKWNSNAKKSNYKLDEENVGKLTVGEYSGQIIVTTTGGTFTYDGQAHGADVSVSTLPKGYTLETASSNATATNVDDGEVKATADTLVIRNASGDDVTSNLNIRHIDGTIKITPATLTVTTPDASKVYDGSALKAEGGYFGLMDGETVNFVTTGSQTDKGSSTNTYELQWTGSAKESNYTVSESLGTLTVTEQSIVPDPDDPAYKGVEINKPEDKTYDGAKHKWAPEVKDAAGNALTEGTDYTVVYKRDGKETTDFTNVGTIEVIIKGEGNYKGSVTKKYEITKAPLEVSTPDATKVYDGTPLTAAATSDNISGLVAGETAAVKATGSQTKVGSSDNTYSGIEWGTAKESNYYVKSTTVGELKVTEQSITPGTDPENPDPSYAGVQIDDPKGKTYDGLALKWIPEVKDAAGNALTEGADYTVVYKRDGKETTDFTNVGAIEVTITGIGNYKGTVTKSYQITKRPVTLTSESYTFTYNGKDQGWNKFTCSDELFESQVDDLGCTVTVKQAGEQKENTVSYTFKSGFSAGNYQITTNFGTLYVKDSEDEIVVTTTGGTFTYDGKAHGATVSVSALPDGYTLETASSSATATNVAEGEVAATADTLVIFNAEGEDVTASLNIKRIDGTIQITPAAYSVTTGSVTKVYDGTALLGSEAKGNEVGGLVNEADATFTVTGSQTEVGGSEGNNTYTLKFASEQMAKNYKLDGESLGTLTVTGQSIDPDDPDAYKGVEIDSPEDKTYDGNEHKWAPEVKDAAGNTLTEGTDYEVSCDTDNFTDVTGTITVTITGKGNYTGSVTREYQITPAAYSVTTGSATKVYDGTALLGSEAKGNEVGGLVNEADATFTVTGSQTEVGGSEGNNTYTLKFASEQMAKNYKLDGESLGTLTVTGQSIDPDDPDAYKGVEIDSPEDKTYDGNEHKWAPEVKDAAGNTLTEGTDYEVSYSTDNFTDVTGAITVTITGKGNYTGSVTREYQITPKGITVESASNQWVYDGEEHSDASATITGLVNKADATAKGTGKITKVGSVENTIELKFASEQMEKNYNVTELKPGTLTVTENADEVVVTTTGGTFTYDGQAHGATVSVSALPDGYTLETASSSATATNVAEGEVKATADNLIVRNASGEDVTSKLKITYVDGTIKIVPAELRITTGSATKAYDGTALTNGDLKITGLVGDDAVVAKTNGSQTEVGSSANTYLIDWGTVDANNYSIVESLGTLTVTKAAVTPSNNDGNNGNDGNGGTARTTTTAATPAAAAAALQNVANAVAGNPESETIYDAENPLGTAEAECWVHYYMILCMILTALYGIGVWAHRANYTRKLRKDMDDVMNDGDGINPEKGELAGTSTVANQA